MDESVGCDTEFSVFQHLAQIIQLGLSAVNHTGRTISNTVNNKKNIKWHSICTAGVTTGRMFSIGMTEMILSAY